jgi:hypothetical protein
MTDDQMRYDRMVETALRAVVREALEHVRDEGLPGDHHFYLTFRTTAPGVSIPDYLHDQYPEEMTIVLQHQFWDLTVAENHFSVTLSFKNRPAELRVPYSALSAFVDPSVKFGLQFTVDPTGTVTVPAIRQEGDLAPMAVDDGEDTARSANEDGEKDGAEVVSLDQFRKK